ncbi:hypothetical protein ACNJYD_19910 [Bradyrhizobium sp. DASA03005]
MKQKKADRDEAIGPLDVAKVFEKETAKEGSDKPNQRGRTP